MKVLTCCLIVITEAYVATNKKNCTDTKVDCTAFFFLKSSLVDEIFPLIAEDTKN